jgi:uracil phosphoribosyltransferase
MEVYNLSQTNSLLNTFLSELRDKQIQHDRMRFRYNLQRIGEVMAYEISKTLVYTREEIETPLGLASIPLMEEQPVLITILRAGLPFHQGFSNYFDKADCGYVTAFRKYSSETEFDIVIQYLASPDLTNRILILVDPMLASGSSLAKVYKQLVDKGKPKQVIFASVLASPEGVEYLKEETPEVTLWTAAIDEKLNAHGYILPGLGDAGDLAFGDKL